jgi:hypothetical protein
MARLTQGVTTTLGAHRLVDRWVLYGKSLGLSVTHESAGGWFEKSHIVSASGNPQAVRRFADSLAGWCR